MKLRFASLALALALIAAFIATPFSAVAAPPQSGLLRNVPVEGTLSDGGTFEGVLTITEFAYANGQLLASGTLQGTATLADGTTQEVTQAFADTVASLQQATQQARCDILNLDLGPINLDLLGLVIDLSAIELDIFAVPGPGNLLGNLLCALAGLLDGGLANAINNLINLINRLL